MSYPTDLVPVIAHMIVGDTKPVWVTCTVNGTKTDPATVSYTIVDPSGTSTTYTYAGGGVTKDSTGVYYRLITGSKSGFYRIRVETTGSPKRVSECLLEVVSSVTLSA